MHYFLYFYSTILKRKEVLEILHTLTMATASQPTFEKALVVHILGVISALENNAITIDEAEQMWFAPQTITLLKRKAISEDIVAVLQFGKGLRNISTLLPHALPKSLSDMKQLAITALHNHSAAVITKKIWQP